MGGKRSTFLQRPVQITLIPGLTLAALGAWIAASKLGGKAWPLGWFVGISAATYVTWWIDKRQSKGKGHRVPEWTLHLLLSLIHI